MNKHSQLILAITLALGLFLAGCANNIAATTAPAPSATITPDPCAPENIDDEALKVHRFMREFDDAANLATSRPREQLAESIADLQRIRRDAEDQVIPLCLGQLKTYQVSHMNAVINTLINFMNGSDQKLIDQGVAVARQLHDQYLLELARVMGQTVQAATVIPLETTTPAPPGSTTPAP